MAKRSSFLLIFAFILFLMISNSFNACEGGAKLSPNFDFTWTLIYPSPTYEPLHSIAYGNYLGNDTFVAVGGSGTIVVSRDGGSTWKLAKSPTSEYLNKVVYGNNTFVAVGDKGTIVVSSDGGNNWIKNTFEPHLYNIDLYDIAYGGNTFAAVGYNYDDSKYCILVSTDGGKTWEVAPSPTSSPLNLVIYGNNTFVVGGSKMVVGRL
jgi:photosystem II stability/assembly factor-like uncharacterized protein